ncbi:hypothetical protein PUN28_004722 [Cardiocondyla obscurior]|uniref:Uncharacterized protein n=1 Tax=Cardiocondyla obscurior TaxID=286306 RepID=A0AAW2GGA4_9HYME
MQWTRAGGSGSASRSKSSEHHLSVHTEERYTHMYTYIGARHVCKNAQEFRYIPEAEICSPHVYAKDTMHILLAQCKGCTMRRKYRLPRGTQISFNSPRETNGRNCSRGAFKVDCTHIFLSFDFLSIGIVTLNVSFLRTYFSLSRCDIYSMQSTIHPPNIIGSPMVIV